MKAIVLTCPRCAEAVIVPATDQPFATHVCPKTPRRFFAAPIIPPTPALPPTGTP